MHPILALHCSLPGVVGRTLQSVTKQSSFIDYWLHSQPAVGLANCSAAACYATLLLLLPQRECRCKLYLTLPCSCWNVGLTPAAPSALSARGTQ